MNPVDLARITARRVRDFARLSNVGRREVIREWRGLSTQAPDISAAIAAVTQWLVDAQQESTSRDGGVASYYSLRDGWAASYPETTGYIIPTFIEQAAGGGNDELLHRARRMLDWLLSIQFSDGGFPGGTVGAQPQVPVTFNTGQILLGLAAGVMAFGEQYRKAMCAAGDWLVKTQDSDGCWRRFPSPFTKPGEKAYDAHVASGLFEADRASPGRGYAETALASVRWALSKQQHNGWFADCCLNDPTQPLTHTIGYVLRGCLEAYRASRETVFLEGSRRAADALLKVMRPDGFIPGRLDGNWNGTVRWACLTGTVQIAHCWLILYAETGTPEYLSAAKISNHFVRRTVLIDNNGPTGVRGGIRGSSPLRGGYCPFWFINWGAKFFIDSHSAELAAVRRPAA